MKKILLSTALAAVAGVAALAPQPASAVDGTITINGKVLAQTCTVDGKGYSANGTITSPDNQTVTLPNVLAPVLNAAGSTAGTTGFTIVIAGCDASLSKVTTTFSGAGIDAANNALTNSAGSNGVEVQLLDSTSTVIPLVNNYAMAPVTLSGGGATLQYYARYYAKNGNATAGTVTSAVSFTMAYQ
ncbi:type 1 fimbrial protein [Dyella halodurans]|uniref:Fimbrial protein n=1 Tax=Dyella halodurans TaxID=1920171 RepID=A0ABV9BYP3_9GAMM|nr:fimbrial protein [Dyella halodurans]